MRTQLVLIPIGEARAVQSNDPDRRLQRAHQNFSECCLARSAGTDDAEDSAGLRAEGRADQDRPSVAAADPDFLNLEQAFGRWKGRVDPLLPHIVERTREAMRGGPRGGE